MQAVSFGIPPIEVADNRDRARVRRPHAEDRASLVFVGREVSSYFVVDAIVAALIEEIEIVLGQKMGLANHSGIRIR